MGILIITVFSSSCKKNTDDPLKDDIVDVVIVGGGFSGLAASYYLEDLDYVVLEKEEKAGGRCMSGNWNGFHYPKGTEYIGKPEKNMQKVFNYLGVHASQIPPPTDGVAYDGNFYFGQNLLGYLNDQEKERYVELQSILESLSNNGIEDAVFDYQDKLNDYADLDNQSVMEWLDQKGYSPLIQKFINIENRGLFGTDNANYSMLFNIPEMAYDLPLVSSINESEVYSFDQGMYSVIEAFAAKLGNRLKTGATVTNVKVNDDNTVKVTYTKNNHEYTITANSVIMATPAKIAGSLVSNHISENVKNTLTNLDYSQYVTINFFLEERLLTETWSVSCIDEEQVVTMYDVIKPQVEEGYTGKSILSVYMSPEHAYDNTYTSQSDESLLNNAYQTLEKYYPGFEEKVLGYDISRFEYAFPIFSQNYRQKIEVFRKDVTLNGPIFLAGDYMVYATVDGAFISGEMAADNVWDYLEK
jgi:protoporphyrinogen oxidase